MKGGCGRLEAPVPAAPARHSSAAAWTPAELYEEAWPPNAPISQKGKMRVRKGNEAGIGPNFPSQTRHQISLLPMTHGWGRGGTEGEITGALTIIRHGDQGFAEYYTYKNKANQTALLRGDEANGEAAGGRARERLTVEASCVGARGPLLRATLGERQRRVLPALDPEPTQAPAPQGSACAEVGLHG